MDVSHILSAYAPKTLRDFVGNHLQKQKMHEFMKSKTETCKIIIGPSGAGKTLFCNLLFKEYDANVVRPNYDEVSTKEELKTFVKTAIRTKTITDMMNKRPKVLFLDDIEVLMAANRCAGSTVLELIQDKSLECKIIITCASAEEKRLSDMKKKADHIKLHCPQANDALVYVMNVFDEEGYDVDAEGLLELIKNLQCNIRNVILSLATCVDIDEEGNNRAYSDMNIFDIVGQIFKTPQKGFDDLDIALSTDPMLISFIMYDNFKGFLAANYDTSSAIYSDGLRKIYEFFTQSSIIEEHAFENGNWSGVEWSNFLKCGSIRALQNQLKRKPIRQEHKISYTTILTRSSQHFSNLKKLNRYASSQDCDHINMMMFAELAFEKGSIKSWKMPAKTEEGSIVSSYSGNICSKDDVVYGRKIKKVSQKKFM